MPSDDHHRERPAGGTPPEFRLRDLRPDTDTAAVRALVLAGLEQHWGVVDATLNPDLDDLPGAHPGSRTVVAVDVDGRVIGTGTVVPRDASTAEVVRMSVDAGCRRSGVGRAVLDELVATAERWGTERVVLETTATWTDTIAFYERNGFRVTHHDDGPFGRDAWFERRAAPTDR